jgi:hypothetical protein
MKTDKKKRTENKERKKAKETRSILIVPTVVVLSMGFSTLESGGCLA